MHHRIRKCDPKFEIFCSEVFSSPVGSENKISYAYHEKSLLHIRKDKKKKRFPVFLDHINVPADCKNNLFYASDFYPISFQSVV